MPGAPLIAVLHEPSGAEPFVVLDKPRGLPSAPLVPGGDSAYTQAEALFPELRRVAGRKAAEHGLLHRLDTATRGLLLVAAGQGFYDYMSRVQQEGLFVKAYDAVCVSVPPQDGFPPAPPLPELAAGAAFSVASRFRPFGKGRIMVRPVTEESGMAAVRKAAPACYRTDVTVAEAAATYRLRCVIARGYRHQVRCHLAWCGLPVCGDPLYNSRWQEDGGFCFDATEIRFPRPDGSGLYTFALGQ